VPGNVYLNAIGTAVPDHEAHSAFIGWAQPKIADPRLAKLFGRMVARSGIEHRWTVLPRADDGGSPIGPGGFYEGGFMPGTDARMRVYAEAAPTLSLAAIDRLAEQVEIDRITHLVVASCTGFVAPGVDQVVARRLGLAPSVERLLVGFMGCYAAVAALRSARHIVRSEPGARVLVVCVELCSLHLQDTGEIEKLLAMLQFGDGAGAALVTSDAAGFELEAPFATTLPDSDRLIRWDITDKGFEMHLSGEVPQRIAQGLADPDFAAAALGGRDVEAIDGWAVHAGGRSILDAVETAYHLPQGALWASRETLHDYGNMSSATLIFALGKMLKGPRIDQGIALAFGPGLAAEGFGFRSAA
jgi:predicted naringenin-chalcone synthase